MRRRGFLAATLLASAAGACARPTGGPATTPGPSPVPTGTPDDGPYAWLEDVGSELGEAYALTWIADRTPDEVVRSIGARSLGRHRRSDLPEAGPAEDVLVVTGVGRWSFLVESFSSVFDSARLSRGTRSVSYAVNPEVSGDVVLMMNDGVVEVEFDPEYPPGRTGAHPDLLLTEMRAVGLDPAGGTDPREAAFALIERITGIRLTAGLLSDPLYLAAAVPAVTGAVEPRQEVRTQGPG